MDQANLCNWLRENSAGVYRPAAEAASEIERLQALVDKYASERKVWRCRVGNEVFSTHDEGVARSWEKDGFEVEIFFAASESGASGEAFLLPDNTVTKRPDVAAEHWTQACGQARDVLAELVSVTPDLLTGKPVRNLDEIMLRAEKILEKGFNSPTC